MSLENLFDTLNKHFKGDLIVQASSSKCPLMERIKTSSMALNIELGGGIPVGRITELFGELSSGKTSLALDIVRGFTAQGMQCLWIDAEGVFDKAWAQRLGVNLDLLYVVRPETGEQAIDIFDATVRSGDAACVVLDSVPATVPKIEVESSMDSQQMGVHARMMNKMTRKIQSAMNALCGDKPNKTTVLLINQLRNKIGVMYGNPETTPGGMGIPYAASVRIKLKRGEWITKKPDDQIIGHETKFYVEKNKTAPPKTKGSYIFYTHDVPAAGIRAATIDTVDEVTRYGIQTGLIEQAGAWYTMDGQRFQGADKVKEHLRGSPEAVEKMQKAIYGVISGGEIGEAEPPASTEVEPKKKHKRKGKEA